MSTQGGENKPEAMASLLDLHQRVAVVTGGGAGIGAAICGRLAEAGSAVVVVDLPGGGAKSTAEELARWGVRAAVVEGDVRDPAVGAGAMAAATDQLGGLDVLVNCAGIYPSVPALEMTELQWDDIVDINLKGTFLFCQAFGAAQAKRQHPGAVVNISSRAGLRARPGVLAYSAAKAGVVALTQGLAQEFAPLGIRVNAVAPGPIQTGRTAEAAALRVARGDQTAEQWQAAYRARIPLGRYGTADEVAVVVAFLASAAASYITGSVVVVDGGASLP